MEIPGQGNLFDDEPKSSNNDAEKSESDTPWHESVPTKEESIAKIKHILSEEGQEELETQRRLDAERKRQIEEEEAEAMAEAMQLEAEGKYTFNSREWAKVAEQSRRRYIAREVKKFREELARKNQSTDSDNQN